MGLLDNDIPNDDQGGDVHDMLAGASSGPRFFKWGEDVGTGVEGVITKVERRQAREFGTTKLAHYDDGNPIMETIFTLATSLRDDADDDGLRRVALGYRHQKQLAELLAKQGHRLALGATFAMKWTGGRGTSASPRQFAMGYEPAGARSAATSQPPF